MNSMVNYSLIPMILLKPILDFRLIMKRDTDNGIEINRITRTYDQMNQRDELFQEVFGGFLKNPR